MSELEIIALHLLCWERQSLRRLIWKERLNWSEFWKRVKQFPAARLKLHGVSPDKLLLQAERELKLAEKNTIKIITIENELFPECYRQIFFPPLLFYYQGNLAALKSDFLAIVGSRRATGYSRRILERFVPEIVAAGIGVVSGLAFGVDHLAHRITVEQGGITVGVNAASLLHLYPATQRGLAEKMLQRGGLLSEFPLNEKPRPYFFPMRNRLISGLARAVLITEAALKSGSMITARLALEQNRDVLAVVGNIDAPLSAGPNELVKNGARPVLSVADILEEFGIQPATSTYSPELSISRQTLLEIIEKNGMISFDQLLLKSGLFPDELLAALTELEMKELVFEDKGIFYATKR